MNENEQLIIFGGEVKAVGGGLVEGWLVKYTDANNPDLEADYFDDETDHAVDWSHEPVNSTVYYAHGQDENLGTKRLTNYGKMSFTPEVGVWIQHQLDLRDEYEKAIYAMAEQKKLGWSSGTAPHLVSREPNGKARHVKTWPLGLDASYTPQPAAGPELTQVMTIKEWLNTQSLKALLPKAEKDTATDDATVKDDNGNDIKTGDIEMEKEEFIKMLDERDAQKAAEAQKALDLEAEIEKRAEAKAAELFKAEKPDNEVAPAKSKAPAFNKTGLGDTETKALAHYIRTGDGGALGESMKASNAVDMTIGDDTYAGYTVPTGHYQQVIARRDEMLIASKLGIKPIPGKGTTVNVPFDNEADGEFILTSEAADHDLDAPLVGQKALTLLRYSKKYQLSYELLEDEDSNLMAWLNDFVGRGTAKTHNSLLLTEVASNGTALKTFASATVIAVDELEPVVYNNDLSNYLDDAGSVGWVMQAAVHGEILLLDDASTRRYANNQMGNEGGPSLLGYPIVYSAKSGATAASAKSVYFGNWNYVGWRDAGIMTFIRDPYSFDGGIELKYQFRTVYGVLIAEAVGYGVHPSA